MRSEQTSEVIRIEITEAEIVRRLDEIERADIAEDLREFLIKALKALIRLDKLLGMKHTTIARLRKIFAKESERRKQTEGKASKEKKLGKNKGRNGLTQYPIAQKATHSHATLKKGDRCPQCNRGRLFKIDPGLHIKITGSAPLTATVHRTEKLRCSACQMIFEADFRGRDGPKYDAKAKAVIGLLKYGASTPFYRLEKIQKSLLTPLPASTQWDLMEELANDLQWVWRYVLKLAAQGEISHIDDTTAKILLLPSEPEVNKNCSKKKQRTGLYTTGILSKLADQHQIVLYLTGRKYAGENLDEILDKRDQDLPPMIVMRDALNTNNTKRSKVYEVLCLSHARRGFVDLDQKHKAEVDFVLDAIGLIYKNDTHCKEQNLSSQDRLKFHQEHSKQIWYELVAWAKRQIENKIVEPSSDLGAGIKYLINHSERLGRFLEKAGVPLDNNILEEKLRLPVLNRKNFLFYRSQTGALVGDIIMSLIKTSEVNGVNPISYLEAIQEHRSEAKQKPSDWLPWNYQTNINEVPALEP